MPLRYVIECVRVCAHIHTSACMYVTRIPLRSAQLCMASPLGLANLQVPWSHWRMLSKCGRGGCHYDVCTLQTDAITVLYTVYVCLHMCGHAAYGQGFAGECHSLTCLWSGQAPSPQTVEDVACSQDQHNCQGIQVSPTHTMSRCSLSWAVFRHDEC